MPNTGLLSIIDKYYTVNLYKIFYPSRQMVTNGRITTRKGILLIGTSEELPIWMKYKFYAICNSLIFNHINTECRIFIAYV